MQIAAYTFVFLLLATASALVVSYREQLKHEKKRRANLEQMLQQRWKQAEEDFKQELIQVDAQFHADRNILTTLRPAALRRYLTDRIYREVAEVLINENKLLRLSYSTPNSSTVAFKLCFWGLRDSDLFPMQPYDESLDELIAEIKEESVAPVPA